MVSLSWFWQSTSLASLFARSRGRFKLAHQHRADPDKDTALEYSETLNNEYIERIHQMSYSSLSDNGMLQIFSFLN